MAETSELGTTDSQLGNLELAYVSDPAVRPLAGTRIGKLGTLSSMLGNIMLDIGVEEGTGSTIYEVSATSTLSLTDSAGVTNFSRMVNATSVLELTSTAVLTNFVRAISASSTITLSDSASLTFSLGVSAESVLSLTDEATLFPWTITEVAGESTLALTVESTGRHARFFPAAVSTLDFTQAATSVTFWVFDVSGASTLFLTSEGLGRHSHFRPEGESVLSMSATAEGRHAHFRPAAVSTLDFTDAATGRHAHFRPVAESTLALTQLSSTLLSHTFNASGESVIDLFDFCTGRHSHFRAAGTSVLTLTDSNGLVKTLNVGAESFVQVITETYDPVLDEVYYEIEGLQDTATSAHTTSRSAKSVIPLTQRAERYKIIPTAIDVSAASVLALSDQSWRNAVGEAITTLTLSQTATVQRANPTTSVIEFSHTAGVSVVRKRSASSVLELKQSVTYSIVRANITRNYHPFVGEGAAGAPTPPPTTLAGPLAGVTDPFKLVWPATGTYTDSLVLRTPNLGNKDRLSFNRISRETRGGTLVVYADPIWPKIQSLALSFSGLTETEKDDFLEFFDTHLGQEIGLLDWEHRYWKGVIMTPDDPVIQDGRGTFSASFEFEGELDPTWSP